MIRSSRWYALALAVGAVTVAQARPPVEKPDNLLDDHFEMGAAFTYASGTTTLRVDASDGAPGTELSGETDLGLPKHKLIGDLDIMFRPAERHTIRVNYLFLPYDRHATTTLKTQVNFKDATYNIDDAVSSQLSVKVEGMEYAYSLLKSDRYELGLGLGVDLIEVAAQANVPARLAQQHQETSAPVPLGELEGTYRISSRWYLQGEWQYMRATISHIYGSVAVWHAGALYRVNPNVTLGLGFQSYHLVVDSNKSGDTGLVNLKMSGPSLSARVGF